MAEMSRCGRRKQRNPRRKNAEDESASGTAAPSLSNQTPPGTTVTKGQVTTTPSSHIETTQKSASDSQDSIDGESSNEKSLPDDSARLDQSDNHHTTTELDANMDAKNKTDSMNGHLCAEDRKDSLLAEQDQIQEFMSRSDTAVIFPEPVSDQDDSDDDNNSRTKGNALKEQTAGNRSNKVGKYSCPQCDDCFVLKSQLEKHLPVHSPLSQNCKICHKTFANVYRLQRHMISHDESSGLRKFKCPECGKAFKFKHHLKEHIRIHSGEKPFECSNCGKRFSHSGSYSSHMTSKKCWVLGVKLRKPDKIIEESENSPRGPLVPKADQAPIDLQMSTMYASQYPDYVHPFVAPYDPASLPNLPPHLLSQVNRTHPYMPYGGYPSHLVKAVSAFIPTTTPAHQNSKPIHHNTSSNNKKAQKMKPSFEEQKTDSSKEKNSRNESNNKQMQNDKPEEKEEGAKIKVEIKSEKAANSDLNPVEQVLKNIDATVSQQQQSTNDKTAISKLGSAIHDIISHDNTPESLVDKAREALKRHLHTNEEIKSNRGATAASGQTQCRFCKESFVNPIDLHQHERYLCKMNEEIHGANSEMQSKESRSSGAMSPDLASLSTEGTNDDDLDDEDCQDKDGKCRVRSMISEEQLQILRNHYNSNPRPRKFELVRIANDIGFSKRVVQVWFQNMRARDRKKGLDVPYFASMARFPNQDQSAGSMTSPTSQYIPIVPQPYSVPSLHSSPKTVYNMAAATKVNSSLFTPPCLPGAAPYCMQQEPLDLSVKPQPAHTHTKKLTVSVAQPEVEDGVLNLSQKSARENDLTNKTNAKLEHSDIFEYFKEEGLFPKINRHKETADSHHNSINKYDLLSSPSSYKKMLETNNNMAHQGDMYRHHLAGMPTSPPPAHSPVLPPKSSTPVPDISADNVSVQSERLADSLNSSFNSSTSGSLDHAINSSYCVKPKRNRKKSWRQWNGSCIDDERMMWCVSPKRMADICYLSSQYNPLCGYMLKMEAEQVQMDFEDSVSVDDDLPSRKKRKSWKHHKVDDDEGMYACDQCEKRFSKQSSLARHKYEHSGARPFSCDICSKAFKHKHHLTEHKRLHSGEKPFQCKKCGKRFSHSGSFSQHMNHRYKYCKPNGGDADCDEEENEVEESDSA